jgi:hypothetical protein
VWMPSRPGSHTEAACIPEPDGNHTTSWPPYQMHTLYLMPARATIPGWCPHRPVRHHAKSCGQTYQIVVGAWFGREEAKQEIEGEFEKQILRASKPRKQEPTWTSSSSEAAALTRLRPRGRQKLL